MGRGDNITEEEKNELMSIIKKYNEQTSTKRLTQQALATRLEKITHREDGYCQTTISRMLADMNVHYDNRSRKFIIAPVNPVKRSELVRVDCTYYISFVGEKERMKFIEWLLRSRLRYLTYIEDKKNGIVIFLADEEQYRKLDYAIMENVFLTN